MPRGPQLPRGLRKTPPPPHTEGLTAIPIFPHRIRQPQEWTRHPGVSLAPRCYHLPATVMTVERKSTLTRRRVLRYALGT